MAKKRISTKIEDTNRDDYTEEIPETKSSKGPSGNLTYLVIIAGLLLVIAYLLFSGGTTKVDYPTTGPPPDISTDVQQPLLYSGNVPEHFVKPEFVPFFPDNITGMRQVKLDMTRMDSLNSETEGQFQFQVVDKVGVLYLKDGISTDFEIEYWVYKMKSPEAANQVLDYYSSNWNTIPIVKENVTFWIWEGYVGQIAQVQPSRRNGLQIYWDVLTDSAFLPYGGEYGKYYIASITDDLYCYHGETVKDQYFIMVDVHAGQANIEDIGETMLARAAEQIKSSDIE